MPACLPICLSAAYERNLHLAKGNSNKYRRCLCKSHISLSSTFQLFSQQTRVIQSRQRTTKNKRKETKERKGKNGVIWDLGQFVEMQSNKATEKRRFLCCLLPFAQFPCFVPSLLCLCVSACVCVCARFCSCCCYL